MESHNGSQSANRFFEEIYLVQAKFRDLEIHFSRETKKENETSQLASVCIIWPLLSLRLEVSINGHCRKCVLRNPI